MPAGIPRSGLLQALKAGDKLFHGALFPLFDAATRWNPSSPSRASSDSAVKQIPGAIALGRSRPVLISPRGFSGWGRRRRTAIPLQPTGQNGRSALRGRPAKCRAAQGCYTGARPPVKAGVADLVACRLCAAPFR